MVYYYGKNIIFSAQNFFLKGGESFQVCEIFSENQQFILKTEKIIDNTGTYVSFLIKDVYDNVLYECPDKFRIMDLKYIKWDSLNVVVESGDVGTITYLYNNGKWNSAR